jgi:hypothetical protein
MLDRRIVLNQSIERAQVGRSIYIVQDVTLSSVTQDEVLAFRLAKGCLGTTTVEVFNVVTDTPLLVERFSNDDCDAKTFTVAADVLTTASVSPIPVLDPLHLTPPEGGKVVGPCEGATPPQLCVHEMTTSVVIQLTDELDFEVLGSSCWSPDGTQIVFNAGSSQFNDHNLYIISADGSNLRRLTDSDAQDQDGDWSPDGEWIAFYRDGDLWRIRPDGADEQTLFAPDEGGVYATWAPDGQRLVFLYFQTETDSSTWVINADGSDPRQVYAFEDMQLAGGGCVWTPTVHQLLCWYDEQGSVGTEQRVLVNTDGSGTSGTIDGVPYWWSGRYWPRWGLID